MVKLTIDGRDVVVPAGTTILAAAGAIGKEIPVFCYHESLSIAGNCRMCLVEVEKSPKPVASCAMPVAEGMVVKTTSPMVEKARKGVLELLLINHPLDCPVCDQGGECDLQDITMAYGPGVSRFQESKRIVQEKDLGPLIKTAMTRCIHCTRCIRFSEDVTGMGELGAVGRGEDMEIVPYAGQTIRSEMSGNLVDLCPVGALTSKPYAFRGRPWELKSTETIDVLDAMGSHIRVDTVGMRVVRVLPRRCDAVNGEWISDKTRHGIDGLHRQRLDRPYIRQGGELRPASWDDALSLVAQKIAETAPDAMGVLAGDMVDCETLFILTEWMNQGGIQNRDCRMDGAHLTTEDRSSYLFNTSFARIAEGDLCLMIGVDVRAELPLLQARLRGAYLATGMPSFYLGAPLNPRRPLTFPYTDLGDGYHVLNDLIAGVHPLSAQLIAAKRPMVIVGQDALRGEDGPAVAAALKTLRNRYPFTREGWNGFNILHQGASRVGALDLGFVPGVNGLKAADIFRAATHGNLGFLYLLGVDDIPTPPSKDTFVVYQGHHGDQGAMVADVILPGATYTEKDSTFINMEGRLQRTYSALCPPGQAKADWHIVDHLVRRLSAARGGGGFYGTLHDVRTHMADRYPTFGVPEGTIPFNGAVDEESPQGQKKTDGMGNLPETGVFKRAPYNFYMTDVITRHSQTMAACMAASGMQGGDRP